MKNIFIYLIGSCIIFFILADFSGNKKEDIKTEYKLELVNQTEIKVYSVSNDTVYHTTRDSLIKTLDLDNL